MKASIIVIGTELTRGIIQDKHGSLISRELTTLGVHVSEIVALPDDGTIEPVLEALMRSSDLIIITGGLGPTSDDITRSVIARAAGKGLVRDEECWSFLLSKLGDKAYGANSRQAMIPEGFSVIPGASNPDYIKENIQIFDFALTDEEMRQMRSLNKEQRFFNATLEDVERMVWGTKL